MRVGKELFHGRVAHLGAHTALHEGLKIRLGSQVFHVFEAGQGGGSCVGGRGLSDRCGIWLHRFGRSDFRRLGLIQFGWQRPGCDLLLAARPAAEKTLAHAPPPPPLRLPSVLMLTG